MIDLDDYEEWDYIPVKGKPGRKGNISNGKEVKGRPVGSLTKFLARETSRYNRTHKENK